jgi:hypothetical protein
MADSFCDGGAPFFLGDLNQLKSFARWLDDFERAAVCRIVAEDVDARFVVDLKALNKTLAIGVERLGCLNPVDAHKLRSLIVELQRDVAALLAGGLDAYLEPPEAQQQLELQLRTTLQEATPYFRWLGIRTRDELAISDSPTPKKPKRSTERGEGRVKLTAALTKHHKYADGGCLNLRPIGNNELARLAEVDQATASAFFKKQFKGHGKYKATCADAAQLAVALKLLNGEFAPHFLYGAKPPDEDERDEA